MPWSIVPRVDRRGRHWTAAAGHTAFAASLALAVVFGAGCDGPTAGHDDLASLDGSLEAPPEDPPDAKVPLVDAGAWTPLPPDEDPWPAHRPETVECPEHSHGEEAGTFEVETGTCNYAEFVQPLAADIRPGDRLHLTVHHLRLWAPEPATAHIAVQIAGRTIWQAWPSIPSEEQIVDIELVSDFSADATEPVIFHLHNHGVNSWRLVRLERSRS